MNRDGGEDDRRGREGACFRSKKEEGQDQLLAGIQDGVGHEGQGEKERPSPGEEKMKGKGAERG